MGKMNRRKVKFGIISSVVALILILTMQNCAQNSMSFEDLSSLAETLPEQVEDITPPPLPEGFTPPNIDRYTYREDTAYVYGASADDRVALANKIQGYAPPALADIFGKWRRISGNMLYHSTDEVDYTSPANSYCRTELDQNGNWLRAVLNGSNINPGSHETCINSAWFSALSWSLLPSPQRLRHATNSGNFNGFISGVKLDKFHHEAVLTSENADDDEIALILAMVHDANGDIHTLSVARSNGGYVSTNMNWYFRYRKNNENVLTFAGPAVDIIHVNKSDPGKDGWRGKATRVIAVRQGDVITAHASLWGGVADALPVEAGSEIVLNLNEHPELAIFKGKQYYGYGIQSQLGSEFRDIRFKALEEVEFIYDLVTDAVYQLQANGTYALRGDLIAKVSLGYPVIVGNPETQKEFKINHDGQVIQIH